MEHYLLIFFSLCLQVERVADLWHVHSWHPPGGSSLSLHLFCERKEGGKRGDKSLFCRAHYTENLIKPCCLCILVDMFSDHFGCVNANNSIKFGREFGVFIEILIFHLNFLSKTATLRIFLKKSPHWNPYKWQYLIPVQKKVIHSLLTWFDYVSKPLKM